MVGIGLWCLVLVIDFDGVVIVNLDVVNFIVSGFILVGVFYVFSWMFINGVCQNYLVDIVVLDIIDVEQVDVGDNFLVCEDEIVILGVILLSMDCDGQWIQDMM